MPISRGETWIKTQTGWRTIKTIVISSRVNRVTASPISSDSEDETTTKTKNICGIYWESGPPFVILPGESRTKVEFFFISKNAQTGNTSPGIVTIFNKLCFKQSLKNPRRFNYITKLLHVVLKQDLISTNSSSQKKLLHIFEQFVNTVLATEINVHVVRRLLVVLKDRHLANKSSFVNPRFWSHMLNQISEMERQIQKFQVKKLCKGTSNLHTRLIDLPAEALRLILRCFSDHQDIASISLVNRYFYKLTIEVGLWKSLCMFHLSPSKLTFINPNIPSSWRNVYRKTIKRSSMRHSFAEMLVICSHCHFICWKYSPHQCTYDPKIAEQKVPISIPVTPKGFCHLFEK